MIVNLEIFPLGLTALYLSKFGNGASWEDEPLISGVLSRERCPKGREGIIYLQYKTLLTTTYQTNKK